MSEAGTDESVNQRSCGCSICVNLLSSLLFVSSSSVVIGISPIVSNGLYSSLIICCRCRTTPTINASAHRNVTSAEVTADTVQSRQLALTNHIILAMENTVDASIHSSTNTSKRWRHQGRTACAP